MNEELNKIANVFGIIKTLRDLKLVYWYVPGIKGVQAVTVEENHYETKKTLRYILSHVGYTIEERSTDTWHILLSEKLVMVMFFDEQEKDNDRKRTRRSIAY